MAHVHLIGIGGSGLSAIARVLLEQGYTVSGSDRSISSFAQDLASAGVRIISGHAAENVTDADMVVRSSAVPANNPEVVAAHEKGIPVFKRSEFLDHLIADRRCVAVAGTHGKTTTTAMIAWEFFALGQDPSYIIGGVSRNLNGNAHAGKGGVFVIEADEYDFMFHGLHPHVAVVTTLEHDHPDCFPTAGDYTAAFEKFVGQVQPNGVLLVNADQPETLALRSSAPEGARALTYGLSEHADYRAVQVRTNGQGGMSFTAWQALDHSPLAEVTLQVPGEHNVRNALAALAVAHALGCPLAPAVQALGTFNGTGRRFEVIGEPQGITLIDDYAHHPTEIRATLSAARSRYAGRRIWAVWQPHTFSRTRSLLHEFAGSFDLADEVIVTEVYAARESNPGFSSSEVVAAMRHPSAQFVPGFAEVTAHLLNNLRRGDVLLVLSAGDADQVSAQVLRGLQEKEIANG